jgi:hypothetical protein
MQIYTLDAQLRLFKQTQPEPAPRNNTAPVVELDPTRVPISDISILGPETIRQVDVFPLCTELNSSFLRSTTASCSLKAGPAARNPSYMLIKNVEPLFAPYYLLATLMRTGYRC